MRIVPVGDGKLTSPLEINSDLSRFYETFFQECLEGLDVMETGLLNLSAEAGRANSETIHNVFRAAHSIKGGSGTFGFQEITGFTHLLETILDRIRQSSGAPDEETTDVLLQAVDWLRELVAAQMEGRRPDPQQMLAAQEELSRLVSANDDKSVNAPPSRKSGPAEADKQQPDFIVSFKPHENLFWSGNDPLLYLAELGTLGILESRLDISKLPQLSDLDPAACFLAWEIHLTSANCTKEQVRQVFEWIEDDCDIAISEKFAEPETSMPESVIPENAVREVPLIATESKPKTDSAAAGASRDGSSFRVATQKIDAVVDLVGELVITQSMLNCLGEDFQMNDLAKLREGLGQLTRNTRELQETVLKIRMLPVSNLFDRFPRLIRDLSAKLGKLVTLKVSGEQTEMDKTILEKLGDPLVHLVRNSMDHGIERPEARLAAGKSESATLRLHAEHRGGNVFIEVADDGAGLDEARILARARERGLIGKNDKPTSAEIQTLIFAPGFSTATEVTDLSGRGVGMDVVRRNVEELGGRIHLSSRTGQGTTIAIQLPLTLAIMEGQLFRVGDQRFVLPLTSVVESLRVDKAALRTVATGVQLYRLRDDYLRVVNLQTVFSIKGDLKPIEEGLLVVVESREERIALRVDDLLEQQQVVIKSLEANFRKVEGLAGATILGDGTVAMILDVAGVLERSKTTMTA